MNEPTQIELTKDALERLGVSLCRKVLFRELMAYVESDGKRPIGITPCAKCQTRAVKAAGVGFA